MASDHVTNMELGHLVVGHVYGFVAFLSQGFHNFLAIIFRWRNLHTNKNMGVAIIGVTVIKLGDRALAQQAAKLFVASWLFWNSNGENCFSLFAYLGAFRYIA